MTTGNKPLEKVNSMIRNSIMLKLLIITTLMLLLLIPASMIQSIIYEREQMNNNAINEVSAKWANSQQINGPILSIPLVYEYEKDGKAHRRTEILKVLPETLKINGIVDPEKLRRGIYEVVVYKSNLDLSGDFDLNLDIDSTNLKEIQYQNAYLNVGISDLRGIKNKIQFKWGNSNLEVEPGTKISTVIHSGINIKLPNLKDQIGGKTNFQFKLDLQGSHNLSFIPLGSSTEVNLQSSWNSPSFNGKFLPDARSVSDSGFSAEWSILQLNRNFPQSWTNSISNETLQSAAFGMDLLLPLDDYQKSLRSAKYASMTIALTFLIFFLVEVLNQRKIHPLQYVLVGISLILFYTLLVSISEHSNFNLAYGISSLAIVAMISLYSISIFKKAKVVLLLTLILVGIYGFLFVTLQLADYALLMGSIGLSIILGGTMYFTRNINWYKLNFETPEN
jgi:inner membrane protein